MKFRDSLLLKATLCKLCLHVIQTDLLQLVDSNGDIHHLVGVTDSLGNTVENLTVVHLQHNANTELTKYSLDNLNELHLI